MNNIKPFFGIGVLLVILYLCYELVPPFYHNFVFQDWVDQKAKEATYEYNKSEEQIRDEVFKEAQQDSIPITSDQIQVTKNGQMCSIGVAYKVHVDLPFFPQDFQFTAASQNSSIYRR
jgi:hypothetical protein